MTDGLACMLKALIAAILLVCTILPGLAQTGAEISAYQRAVTAMQKGRRQRIGYKIFYPVLAKVDHDLRDVFTSNSLS